MLSGPRITNALVLRTMVSEDETRLHDMGLALPPDWTPRGQFRPYRLKGACDGDLDRVSCVLRLGAS